MIKKNKISYHYWTNDENQKMPGVMITNDSIEIAVANIEKELKSKFENVKFQILKNEIV